MECARTLSHVHASTSAVLRVGRPTVTNHFVRAPVAGRPVRAVARPVAVAEFATSRPAPDAPGAAALDTAYPIMDMATGEELMELVEANKDKMVILMCKAKGCHPCKAFRSKYGTMGAQFTDGIFAEVMGDRNQSTRNLMKATKVRATPTFVIYRGGEQVHMHSGVKTDKLIDAIKAHTLPTEAGAALSAAQLEAMLVD